MEVSEEALRKCVQDAENTTWMKGCKKEMCFKQSNHREESVCRSVRLSVCLFFL